MLSEGSCHSERSEESGSRGSRTDGAAVMEAYGFRKDMTEPEIVAELFKMYQKLTTK